MWCSVRLFFLKKDDLQMKGTFWLGYMLALLSWCAKHDRPIISNITLKSVLAYISFTHFELWIPLFLLNIFCQIVYLSVWKGSLSKKSQSKHHAFIKKNTCVCTLCLSDNYYPVLYDSCRARKNDYVGYGKMIVSLKITHKKHSKSL